MYMKPPHRIVIFHDGKDATILYIYMCVYIHMYMKPPYRIVIFRDGKDATILYIYMCIYTYVYETPVQNRDIP